MLNLGTAFMVIEHISLFASKEKSEEKEFEGSNVLNDSDLGGEEKEMLMLITISLWLSCIFDFGFLGRRVRSF